MRTASSVAFCTMVSRTRTPGFEKLTLAPRAKFLPLIFRLTELPGVTPGGSIEATCGLPGGEAGASSDGAEVPALAAVPGAAVPCGDGEVAPIAKAA